MSGRILNACIRCWNDIDVYRAREFFFTTLGMFSYHDDDKSAIERQMRSDESLKEMSKQDQDDPIIINTGDGKGSKATPVGSEAMLADYLWSNFNAIQRSIITLLKDFTAEHPGVVVNKFLDIWE